MSTPTSSAVDLIDQLAGLAPDSMVHSVRHQRDKVVAATQGSYEALFDAALADLSLAERLIAAREICRLSESPALQAHYEAALQARPAEERAQAESGVRAAALLRFVGLLALRPVEGDRAALLALPTAGLSTPAVVALAQLVGFVAFQLRVLAGLQALRALGEDLAAAPPAAASAEAPFVHPAHLPKPGEPVRIKGFTSETLGWRAWLPVVELDSATPAQLAVLEASHPQAKTSDYYRVLVHQPRVLDQRSVVFNAIMYAPGGLSRAERELASAAVSRLNECVYCAAVHAQRFEQLTKRNDVICQLFDEPRGAGTNARERAIVAASLALTEAPGRFGPSQLQAAREAGLSALELLDLIHAAAIFAWANRLMLNLGEPVYTAST